MSATEQCECDGYRLSCGDRHDPGCPEGAYAMAATEAAERRLPEQPLATVKLNSTLLGALAGRGNMTAAVAAAAMVCLGLELEKAGHDLNTDWCSATYLRLTGPLDTARRMAGPKTRRSAS